MRTTEHMGTRLRFIRALLAAAVLAATFAASASAAPGPRWDLEAFTNTTTAPGSNLQYIMMAENAGGQSTDGSEIVIRAELPAGIVVAAATESVVALDEEHLQLIDCANAEDPAAPLPGASSIVCKSSFIVPPLSIQKVLISTEVDPGASGRHIARFEVSGGGSPAAASIAPVEVTEAPPVFGIAGFDGFFSANASGAPLTQAGGHPYEAVTTLAFNATTNPNPLKGAPWPVESSKDISVALPPGLVGKVAGVPQCTLGELAHGEGIAPRPLCPTASQVGTIGLAIKPLGSQKPEPRPIALYNMVPPPGVPARFSFNYAGTIVALDAELRQDDHGLTINSNNITQALAVSGVKTSFWGVPSAPDHDGQRQCPDNESPAYGGPTCVSDAPEMAFMRYPTDCGSSGLPLTVRMDSWVHPGAFVESSFRTHAPPGYPHSPEEQGPEVGVGGCDQVPVRGSLAAAPTTNAASSSSGLDVDFQVPNPGIGEPGAISSSDIKAVKVMLPAGMAINPSQAEGLGACSPAQYASTKLSSGGCPEDSKIGSVEVHTPLLAEAIPGSVYVATPHDNPFGSLIALYVVLDEPQRGVLVKLPGKVDTDPSTGQISASFDDLPQLPFSDFQLHFRSGPRAPLVTPASCGTYTTRTEITGWSAPGDPIVSQSSFATSAGAGGASCPAGAPFAPGFSAGSTNALSGAFSPFAIRLTRSDADQELSGFAADLPKGVLAKIADVGRCSEASIVAARSHSGAIEQVSPSCPASTRIGSTLALAGVGSVLTQVPGSLYLAGPYGGAALSVVSVTPALAGPFDLGTVVVREGLTLDPESGEVKVLGSDPIPHILHGIPLRLRELRIGVDRSGFTTTPTSCDPTTVRAGIGGARGSSATPSDRYQVGDCSRLAFKPRLSLRLKGAAKRSGNPGLTAVLRPRPGNANLGRVQVALPHSEFLAQSHIRTICTRVQFAQNACPRGSIYGKVTATSPLLGYPLTGKVYLRSSNHNLPDMVLALRGPAYEPIAIDAVGRIDSHRGGIRTTFEGLPDAPLTRVVLRLPAGRKSLIENSTNICRNRQRAEVKMDAQSGRASDFRVPLRIKCPKRKGQHGHGRGRS